MFVSGVEIGQWDSGSKSWGPGGPLQCVCQWWTYVPKGVLGRGHKGPMRVKCAFVRGGQSLGTYATLLRGGEV